MAWPTKYNYYIKQFHVYRLHDAVLVYCRLGNWNCWKKKVWKISKSDGTRHEFTAKACQWLVVQYRCTGVFQVYYNNGLNINEFRWYDTLVQFEQLPSRDDHLHVYNNYIDQLASRLTRRRRRRHLERVPRRRPVFRSLCKCTYNNI